MWLEVSVGLSLFPTPSFDLVLDPPRYSPNSRVGGSLPGDTALPSHQAQGRRLWSRQEVSALRSEPSQAQVATDTHLP